MAWAVQVNEGTIDITRQGSTWWNWYRVRHESTGRIRDIKPGCIVGGLAEVACDDKADAEWLAKHAVEFGGVPTRAVKVVRATAGGGQ